MEENTNIFKFKNKTFEELKNMEISEFFKLLNSHIQRKFKRGFTEQEEKLLKKINENQKNIKTHCRSMVIIPKMIGHKISIHNGNKEWVQVNLAQEMLGLRLGEFAPTRKIGIKHSSKKKTEDTKTEDKK